MPLPTDDTLKKAAACGQAAQGSGASTGQQQANPAPLTVTADAVKRAAARCPDAKRILAELFPQVFDDLVRFNGQQLHSVPYIATRAVGKYAGQGLYLDSNYCWEVVKDDVGYSVLIARHKS